MAKSAPAEFSEPSLDEPDKDFIGNKVRSQ